MSEKETDTKGSKEIDQPGKKRKETVSESEHNRVVGVLEQIDDSELPQSVKDVFKNS